MSFRVFDLRSQLPAIEKELQGRPASDKFTWLSARGEVTVNPTTASWRQPTYFFESREGISHPFFFDDDERIVIVGDHCTYRAGD